MAFKAITTPLIHVKHDDSDEEMPGLDSVCPNGAFLSLIFSHLLRVSADVR